MKIDEPYLHTHPKTGGLYYRRGFPPRLRSFIPGNPTELKASLGAKSILALGVAERFWENARDYDALYIKAVKLKDGAFDKLAPHDIAFLAGVFGQEALDDDHTGRWDASERNLYKGVVAQLAAAGIAYKTPWEGREGQRWALKKRDTVEAALKDHQAMRASGDLEAIVDWWREEALIIADARGYVLDPTDEEGISDLCRALNDASIAAGKVMLVRLDGDEYPPTPPEPVSPKAPQGTSGNAPAAQTFREIVEGMLGNSRYSIGIPTRAQVSTALRYLSDVLGDLRPEELTRAKVTQWLDTIGRRPAFVSAAERVMPLPDLVALYADQEVKRAGQGTLKKHCSVMSKRWSHAVQEGLIAEGISNPFSGRSFELPGEDEREATGFSPDELRGIFSLPFFTGGPQPRWGRGEAAYWVPLLSLYTGARPEEAAQLVLSDIYPDPDTGREVLGFVGTADHPEKGKQRLKTKEKGTGPRIFPVSNDLIALGFLDYVKWLRDQGEEALFPLLRVRNKFNRLYPSLGENWCKT